MHAALLITKFKTYRLYMYSNLRENRSYKLHLMKKYRYTVLTEKTYRYVNQYRSQLCNLLLLKI